MRMTRFLRDKYEKPKERIEQPQYSIVAKALAQVLLD